MALKRKIRRRLRRKAPPVRRPNPAGSHQAQQTGLVVGGAHDPAEKAADRMAAQVLSGPALGSAAEGTALRRKCTACEDKDKQAKRSPHAAPAIAPGTASAVAPKSAARAVSEMGSGRPLSMPERGFFEPRFGQDLSDVRVHEGPGADHATAALDARAFAHGSDVAFAAGQNTRANMAHELAHVVQDNGRASRLRRLGDLSKLPGSMSCPVASSSAAGHPVENILFPVGGSTLTADARSRLSGVAAGFHALGTSPNMRVDGFASTDGPDQTNWTLSCSRAAAVRSELAAPSDGTPGITPANLSSFAQGETSEFSPRLAQNRRATVRSDQIFAPSSCGSGARVGRASASVQPVAIANDDGSSPTTVPNLQEVADIWGRCCIDVTINATRTISGTRFREIEDAGSGAAPTVEQNDLFALTGESNAVEVFFVDTIRRGADAGTHVAGGGTTKNSGSANAKIFVVRGVLPSIVAHELAHAFNVHHGLGVRADGVSTIARPTGAHNRAAAQNVSDAICTNARANANVTGAGATGACCRDLS
ncbi:DUF4157 domain-containing protein [Rhodobacteraceae bacterium F11138]|nr:DUF4157 domain-containing protein [Rhodobacteraceae bacterium F11138]